MQYSEKFGGDNVKCLNEARNQAREAIESLYEGTCSIVKYEGAKDEGSAVTHHEEVTVVENQPCKLSFESLHAAALSDTASGVSQEIKLFLAPEVEIEPGSKIIVEQHGVRRTYEASGEAAVYPTHQEIMLDLCERWA